MKNRNEKSDTICPVRMKMLTNFTIHIFSIPPVEVFKVKKVVLLIIGRISWGNFSFRKDPPWSKMTTRFGQLKWNSCRKHPADVSASASEMTVKLKLHLASAFIQAKERKKHS